MLLIKLCAHHFKLISSALICTRCSLCMRLVLQCIDCSHMQCAYSICYHKNMQLKLILMLVCTQSRHACCLLENYHYTVNHLVAMPSLNHQFLCVLSVHLIINVRKSKGTHMITSTADCVTPRQHNSCIRGTSETFQH